MAKWYAIPTTMAMTHEEYEANITGMNIVFGAVLGFVLADASDLPPFEFSLVLLFSASVVVMILYLASSPYKLFYAVSSVLAVAALPYVLERLLRIEPLPNLQSTLAVWTAMVLIVVAMPRERPPTETKENS